MRHAEQGAILATALPQQHEPPAGILVSGPTVTFSDAHGQPSHAQAKPAQPLGCQMSYKDVCKSGPCHPPLRQHGTDNAAVFDGPHTTPVLRYEEAWYAARLLERVAPPMSGEHASHAFGDQSSMMMIDDRFQGWPLPPCWCRNVKPMGIASPPLFNLQQVRLQCSAMMICKGLPCCRLPSLGLKDLT